MPLATNAAVQPLEPRRLFAAGDPLDSFGRHGVAFTPYELYDADLSQVEPTPAGKLLAGVSHQYFPDTRPGVKASFVQFNADGSPDLSFGEGGHADSVFSSVRRLAVRPDGAFYALASDHRFTAHNTYEQDETAVVTGRDNWFVARFLPDGRPDRSFGRRGRIALRLDRTTREIGFFAAYYNNSSVLDADGRLTLLADLGSGKKGSPIEPVVLRYDTTGGLDPTFNGGQPLRLQTADDRWTSPTMTVTADGGVLVTAVRAFKRHETTVIKRFTADGTPDAAFGRAGVVTAATRVTQQATSAVAANGSVFYSGDEYTIGRNGNTDSALFLRKFRPDGTPDTAFAGGRLALTLYDSIGSLIPLADGGVVTGTGFMMRRYHADGTADETFGRVSDASGLPVLVGDTIYAVTEGRAQTNRQGKPVERHAVTALSLGGTGRSPLAVSNGHVSLYGSSDDEDLEVVARVITGDTVSFLEFSTGYWSRALPVSDVRSIDLYGEAGYDNLFADLLGVTGLPVTLHGGPGNDSLARNGDDGFVTAYGDAGHDLFYDVIVKDPDPA